MALGVFENLFPKPSQEEAIDEAVVGALAGLAAEQEAPKAAKKETKKFKVRQAPQQLKQYTAKRQEDLAGMSAKLAGLNLPMERQARIQGLLNKAVEAETQQNIARTKRFVQENKEDIGVREQRALRADIKDVSGEKKGRKEWLAQQAPALLEAEEIGRRVPAMVAGGVEKFIGETAQLPSTLLQQAQQVAADETRNPLQRLVAGAASNPLNMAVYGGLAQLGRGIAGRGQEVLGEVKEDLRKEDSKVGEAAAEFIPAVAPYLIPGGQVRGAGTLAAKATSKLPGVLRSVAKAGLREGIEDSAINAIASANELQEAIKAGDITMEEAVKKFPQTMAINLGTDVVGAGVLKGLGKAATKPLEAVRAKQIKAERGRKIQAGQEKIQAERDLLDTQLKEREELDDYLMGLGVKQGEEVAKAQKPLARQQKILEKEIAKAKKEAKTPTDAAKAERKVIEQNIEKTSDSRYLATFQDAVYKTGDEKLINKYENRKAKIIQEEQPKAMKEGVETTPARASDLESATTPLETQTQRISEAPSPQIEGPPGKIDSEFEQPVLGAQKIEQQLPQDIQKTLDKPLESVPITKDTTPPLKKQDAITLKERKLAKSIRESEQIAPAVKEKFKEGEYNYEVRKNRELVQSARVRIEEKGLEKAEADLLKKEKVDFTDDDIAEGIEIAKRYQEAGNIEESVRVFDELVQAGTEKGRAVQAFRTLNMYENMSPETALYAATKRVRKAQTKGKNAKIAEAADVAASEVKEGAKRIIRKKAKELVDEIDKFCGF